MSGSILGPDGAPYDPRSGLHVAEQAHAAGAVTAADVMPLHDVVLSFTVHGTPFQARQLVAALERFALSEDVTRVTSSITGRPA